MEFFMCCSEDEEDVRLQELVVDDSAADDADVCEAGDEHHDENADDNYDGDGNADVEIADGVGVFAPAPCRSTNGGGACFTHLPAL